MLRRHMNATTVIAILALVFAMTSGAFAVTSKDGGHATAVAAKKKGKKGKAKALRGPRGPQGPEGKQGPAGTAGKDGVNGKDGLTGKEGVAGKEGPAGKSVVTSAASGAECAEGGTRLEVEGSGIPSHVCNGEKGVIHPGETLPSEASETGTWLLFRTGSDTFTNISFTIPLAHPVAEAKIKIEPEGYTGGGEGCPGTAEDAKAEPGFLCIYTTLNEGEGINPLVVAPVPTDNGAFLVGYGAEGKYALGTWAVTAE